MALFWNQNISFLRAPMGRIREKRREGEEEEEEEKRRRKKEGDKRSKVWICMVFYEL